MTLRLILLTLALAVHSLAAAQPAAGWAFSIEGALAHQAEADLGAAGPGETAGEFSLDRAFIGASLDYLWSPRTAFGINLGGGQTRYDFGGSTGLGLDPWRDIEDWRVSLVSRFAINDRVSGIVIPSYRVNRESGASTRDADTLGLLAGLSWRLREGLTIGPGIGVFERIEESTQVFPILVIDWDITERWNLSTGRGLAASQGPGLTLSYAATDDWNVGIAGRYEQADFRLAEDGPVPNGIGRDETFPLVATAEWSPNPGTRLALFLGAEFSGELELADGEGNAIATSEYDTALILGGSFAFRF